MKKILIAWGIVAVASLANADLLMQDNFTYVDGLTTNVSGGLWVRHSGTANNSFVANNQLEVFATRADDVSRSIGSTVSAGTLYYSLTMSVTSLPTATGAYIAHFMQDATSFRDRIYLRTTGAAAGTFRIGIGNASSFGTDWGFDLLTNTTYTIVVRANLDTDESVLWINPLSESSTSVTNISASTFNVNSIGFRQATGGGNVYIDNLAVGTTFGSVVPEPTTITMMALAAACIYGSRRRLAS